MVDEYVQALQRTAFFGNMPQEDLEQVAECLQRRRRSSGEIVFNVGDPGHALYIVTEGEVKISVETSTGEEMILALLGPGDTFGELALIDAKPRSATATATTTEPTGLLILLRDEFNALLDRRPALARSVLQSLASVIRNMNQRLADVAMLNVASRINKALLSLIERHGRETRDGIVIDHEVTMEYLAGLTLLYPTEVEKVMKEYDLRNITQWDRVKGKLIVKDVDKLTVGA